ncbi:MAG: choice-of-anchor D domain-containing protein [Luteolibacter sp.]
MRPASRASKFVDSLIGLFLILFVFSGMAKAADVSGTVTLVWNTNPESDIAGYNLLFGRSSGSYIDGRAMGAVNEVTINGLTPGTTYYCVIQAYNTSQNYSLLSQEISFVVPQPASTPDIALEQSDGLALTDGQSTLSFGDASIITGGLTRNFTIKNTGDESLNNLAMTLDGADPSSFEVSTGLSLNVRVAAEPTALVTTLAPGASTSFSVTFKPQTLGSKTAALHISSNDPDENPFDLALTGNAMGLPEIAVSQTIGGNLTDDVSSVYFANSLLGTASAPEKLVIQNRGTSALTDLSITMDGTDGAQFIVGPLPTATLAPGESTTVDVLFTPISVGTKNAILHIFSNDSDENPFDIKLVGNGIAVPDLVVSQADGTLLTSGAPAISLGSANVGTDGSTKLLTLRNIGTADLTGLGVVTDGNSARDFSIEPLTATALAPGATATLKVTFKPTAGGERTATVHIISNDTRQNPFNINLAGTGITAPEIAIFQSGELELTSGSGATNFGSVLVGSASAPLSFTIKNSGNADLTGLALATSSTDFVTSSLASPVLAPGASVTFTVSFKSNTAGSHTTVLRVASNDADENPFEINLTGIGTVVPEIAIEQSDRTSLTTGSATITFGSLNLGATSAAQTFTIKNLGNGNLTGIAITSDGNNSADYIVDGLSASTIAPGASATFQILFKPTAVGTRTAALHVASNDADENPFDIKLEGTGNGVPEISVARGNAQLTDNISTINLGKVNLGSSSDTQTVTIKNLGSSALTGLSITSDGNNPEDFSISAPATTSLAPAATTTFTLAFSPSAEGSKSAVLHINSNDTDENPFDIRLEGQAGTVPVLALEQLDGSWITDDSVSWNFAALTLGSSSTPQAFTLKNIGTAAVTHLITAIVGKNAPDFILNGLEVDTLEPGEITTLLVTFKPTTPGGRTVRLNITSGDQTASPFEITLTGTGIGLPEIAVSVTSGNDLSNGKFLCAFGEQEVGSSSDDKSFTIKNIGTASLTGLKLALTGAQASDFETSELRKTTLLPGASTTFRISFEPTDSGSRTASLRLVSNDADESPFQINLSGTGITAPEIDVKLNGGGTLQDGNSFLNFGAVARGSKGRTKVITIRNVGTAKLTGLALGKNGINDSDFAVSGLRTTTLAPGASTKVNITFKPSAGGVRWSLLHVTSNDADEHSFDIVLTGRSKWSGNSEASAPLVPTAARITHAPVTKGITVIGGQKYQTLTISWPAGQRDMSCKVEVSSNLLDWFSGKDHTTVLVSNGTTLTIRDNTPITQDDKRFIRVKSN